MKYLKKFEAWIVRGLQYKTQHQKESAPMRNFNEKHYWLVPAKPIEKFKIALKKIEDFNVNNIKEWCDIFESSNIKEDKIYVIHVLDADEYIINEYWDWENLDFLPEKNDFYEGEVIVEDWEVDVEKYNV